MASDAPAAGAPKPGQRPPAVFSAAGGPKGPQEASRGSLGAVAAAAAAIKAQKPPAGCWGASRGNCWRLQNHASARDITNPRKSSTDL